ncbi:unnamed protein product [Pylaiella littoralis]
MNITKENFETSFEEICEAIRASHFIALDTEFTGLRLPGAAKEKMFDSIQARYESARDSCSQFMLTQYGVCCFRYKDDDDKGEGTGSGRLEARPFNCFIVPSTKFDSDRVYSCQASSMDFLSNHGFDFQTWAAHGVPFLSRVEEEAILDKHKARWEKAAAAVEKKQAAAAAAAAVAAVAAAGAVATDDSARPVAVVAAAAAAAAAAGPGAVAAEPSVHTARDGTTIESLEEPDKTMVKDALAKVESILAESISEGKYVQKSFKLDPMNGRQRWLMHEFVDSSSPDIKLCSLQGPAYARPMEIRTVCKDPEEQAKAEAKLRAEDEAKQLRSLSRAVGFRRVMDEIFKAGKPVVCHNGLLDLLHTHDKFVGPIPKDLDEGTRALHSLVPRLFDSKVAMTSAMAAGMRFPRAVLGEAHQWLRETFPAPPPPQEEEEGGGKGEVAEATAMATDQPGGTTAMSVESPPREANGTSASSGDTTASAATAAVGAPPVPSGASGADEVEAGAEGIKEEADREASAAVAAAASERARQGWDAVFAPGFEDCYKDGGHEHEAAYDAFLTGCCFAAAATVGLGVRVEELKAMASGGETPASLGPLMNVLPLHRMVAGQQICLPGPAPPVDFGRFIHVSGFPPGARIDAIMRPIKAVNACEDAWFHMNDNTSGVVECKSEEGVTALLESAAAAAAVAGTAAVAASANGDAQAGSSGTTAAAESEPPPREVHRTQLSLGGMKLVQMDRALLNGCRTLEEVRVEEREGEKRGAKRPRQEDDKKGAAAENKRASASGEAI